MMYELRPLAGRSAQELAENARALDALYGEGAAQRELNARQAARTLNLRGDDLPPSDPWDAAKARAHRNGETFDPIAAAGIRAALSYVGDPHDAETRRREQAKRTTVQRTQFEVCLGACVVLADGTTISELERIDESLVAHPHANEILRVLVQRGIVSKIDPDTAWLRSLDPSVGPWVATCDVEFSNGKRFKRGDSVREEDCPHRRGPRLITDDMRASDLSVAELRRLIVEEIDARVPRNGPPIPPKLSEWQAATLAGVTGIAKVVQNPNYRAPSAAKKATKS